MMSYDLPTLCFALASLEPNPWAWFSLCFSSDSVMSFIAQWMRMMYNK